MSETSNNWKIMIKRVKKNISRLNLLEIQRRRHRLPEKIKSDKPWLDLQYSDAKRTKIRKPHELEKKMKEPPDLIDEPIIHRIQGSMIGLALGDALGAYVEFRPHEFLVEHPVTDLESGGTWGLEKGQFTDDTSMTLCLANSLVTKRGFNPYDQLVRYKWWYENGYMSSTGRCFDIGKATRISIQTFIKRQSELAKKYNVKFEEIDYLSDEKILDDIDAYCSQPMEAGNGALMRLAPVPLFFYRFPEIAIEYAGFSGLFTHGARVAYDACRYYAALIIAALIGETKEELLDKQFYEKHQQWFGEEPLCDEIKTVAEGSYQKKGGYDEGIRGKGYIVRALEAALWAFWSDENSFEKGVLAAINLGDDTDTTAAIYGQLAGAYYGLEKLPEQWIKDLYAKNFILNLSKWIAYEGSLWGRTENSDQVMSILYSRQQPNDSNNNLSEHKLNSNIQSSLNTTSFMSSDLIEHRRTTNDKTVEDTVVFRDFAMNRRRNPLDTTVDVSHFTMTNQSYD